MPTRTAQTIKRFPNRVETYTGRITFPNGEKTAKPCQVCGSVGNNTKIWDREFGTVVVCWECWGKWEANHDNSK